MAQVERSGDQRFAGGDLDWLTREPPTPSDWLAPYCDAGSVLLAERAGEILGFVASGPRDGDWVIFQISVGLEAQGKGVGKALMLATLEQGRAMNCAAAILTTYRDVAWNAPWYSRFGFEEVAPDFSPMIVRMRGNEAAHGHDMSRRCAMRLAL